MYKCILYEKKDGAAIITIDQLQDNNRINRAACTELAEAFAQAQKEADVRGIVVTGKEDYFCTGGRMDGYPGGPTMTIRGFADALVGVMTAMHNVRKPIVGAINGKCFAAGMMILDACDLAVASDTCRFGLPELARGNFPILALAIVQKSLPKKLVFELAFRGTLIDSETAKQWNLINEIVPPEKVVSTATEWVKQIGAYNMVAASLGRECYHKMLGMSLFDALEYCKNLTVNLLTTEDAQEADRALKENRPPVLKGF